MAMRFGDHRERFIEDIHPPADGDGFNTRQAHVRRQAIGVLEERYLRRHSFAGRSAPAEDEAITRPAPSFHFTRVPPLGLLDVPTASLAVLASTVLMETELPVWRVSHRLGMLWQSLWRPVRRWEAAVFLGATALAASTWQRVRALHMPHLSRKYSATRGVYIDWLERRRLWQLKWLLFPIAAAVVFLLAVVPLQISTHLNMPKGNAPKRHAQGNAQTFNPVSSTNTATSGNVSRSSQSAGSTLQNSGSGTPALTSNGSSAPTNSGSTELGAGSTAGTVTVPLPSSGGTGGTTAPTSSSGSSSGTTTPSTSSLPVLNNTSTVSVPPLSVSTGDKQLVGTSGTSVTLN